MAQLTTVKGRSGAWLGTRWRVSRLGGEPSNLQLEVLFGGKRSIGRLLHRPSNEILQLGFVYGLNGLKANGWVRAALVKILLIL